MKKNYLLTVGMLLMAIFYSHSQIGVGTTAPQAALDITSATNGMLVPRVALAAKNTSAPVVNPQGGALVNGTFVWNTATAGTAPNNVLPGFYYWSGSAWVEVGSSVSNQWALLGNSGTTAGTNFVGTTDAQDIRFKTGGTDKFNIGNTSGALTSFGAGTAAAPTYSWNVSSNTGVFLPLTGNLGFSAAGSEKMRVQSNGNVAIGTTTADVSALLDVSATNKGVSFPNVNLVSETDAATIATPKSGLMVYNTNGALPCGKGLYFNNGTTTAPIWTCFTKTTREYHAYNSAQRASVTSATQTLQPGCTISFTVPTGQTADVKIDGVLGGINVSTTTSAYSIIEAVIYVDGTFLPQGGWNRLTIVNPTNTNALGVCALNSYTTLGAGAHTIQLYSARYSGTSAVGIGGNCATDVNCGELHATVTYR